MRPAALDDEATVRRQDPHGLLGRIEGLPEQCEEGWAQAAALELPEAAAGARQAVVLGMGGSAIAGDLLGALSALSGRRPLTVVRGYQAPAFAGEGTLAIACSHSGDTDETLAAFAAALDAGASGFVVTTGGRLLALARERGVPAYVYQYEGESRSALGHQLMALLALGERIGLVEEQGDAVREAIALLWRQREQLGFAVAGPDNAAKQLALRLHGRLPVIVAGGILTEAAHRWKTQLNENGKCWAMYEALPELDHNSIEGFALARQVLPYLHVVFLTNASLGERLATAYEATAAELTQAGVSHERVETEGASPLAQALSAIFFGDLTSYYLGLLNGVEPSPVPGIARFKARLERD